MKVYISGAITGINDYIERFSKAEENLKRKGYEVINPAKVNSYLPVSTTYDEYMEMCFTMLRMCDAIYMLKDWKESNGAKIEYNVAERTNKLILFEE